MTDTPISKAAVLAILRSPAASDTFPDMIARVEALEGGGVRVKALIFGPFQEGGCMGRPYPFQYFITQAHNGRFLCHHDETWHDSLQDAQATAQEHYQIAALEPVAQPEPGPVAAERERCARIAEKRFEAADANGNIHGANMALGIRSSILAGNAPRIRLSAIDAFDPACPRCEDGWVCENHPAKAWPTQCDCGAGMPCKCNPLRSAGEQPTPGQFTTMCLAIEDVITGRGFDVAIPEAVKDYMRNVLMVAGWRGERE